MSEAERIQILEEEIHRLKESLRKQQHDLEMMKRSLYGEGVKIPAVSVKREERQTLENFIGLRLIHLVGIVVLVIGLSIGVKYAIDQELISIQMRIGLAYVAGAVLYGLSLRLRKRYSQFSAILFSGAMATFYFTTFAAHSFYALIPFAVSFILMSMITVFTVTEATRYNRQEIGILGMIGAYGIPFLISQNEGRIDLLLLYIFIINIGVVVLSVRQQWRAVASIAQHLTWTIFIGLIVVGYEDYWSWLAVASIPLFFLLFSVPLLASFFRKEAFQEEDILRMVLQNAAFFIALLVLFRKEHVTSDPDAAASFTAAVWLAVQALLFQRWWKGSGVAVRMLSYASLLLFVLFVAQAWNGLWVTFIWMVMAVVIFGWGVFRNSVPARMAAILLMGLTLGKLVLADSLRFSAVQKVIAYLALGVLLLFISFYYQRFREKLFGKTGEIKD